MLNEDYCDFETAKLLKEKGFDGKCSKVWIYSKSINLQNNAQLVSSPYFMEGEPVIDNADINKVLATEDFYEDAYLCPTLQMTMKYLREVHNIVIVIEPHAYDYVNEKNKSYSCSLWIGDNYYEYLEARYYPSYEDAAKAALKYVLKNLI